VLSLADSEALLLICSSDCVSRLDVMTTRIQPDFAMLPLANIEQCDELLFSSGAGQMQSLLDSVKRLGVLVPIVVTKIASSRYQIVDGHRRYHCAALLGFDEIPCFIVSDLDEGTFHLLRYDLNTTSKPWTDSERKKATTRLASIKSSNN